jgi:glycosyltransferase involved in cell wall biosynthesis
MISVSVAMATFNGAQFICEQLDSLAAQSYLPSELIISDDGSTDETLQLVNDFAGKVSFPVIVHRNDARLGYRANFLQATTFCRSDLIAFCDQDDVWHRRKIELCVPFFDNPEVLLVCHGATVMAANGSTVGLIDYRAASAAINSPMSTGPWPFAHGFTQMFRRSLPFLPGLWASSVDHCRTNERMAHDQWFLFLGSVLGSIAYVKEPLARYRQHDRNAMGWDGGGARLVDGARLFFTNFADRYAGAEMCARSYADILDRAKEGWNETWSHRASIAAARYRILAQQCANRNVLYTATETNRRLTAFTNILLSGGYRWHDPFSFGPKSLAKDASFGIFLGHRLKKHRDSESWRDGLHGSADAIEPRVR